jgi:TPR repeat protein
LLASGVCAAQSANTNPQVQAFEKKANEGDLVSMNMLGNIYKNGSLGVDKNLAEAKKWWERAAEKDYAPAYFNLGILYETGSDVAPKNINKAKEYYQKAVNLGFTKANERLASLASSPQAQTPPPSPLANKKPTPIYGQGCDANNEKEAQTWMTLLLYSYVESSARNKCGWNFDRREAATLELTANSQVRKCWGEDLHNHLQKSYKKRAEELTMSCNSADMKDLKSGYGKINTK